MSLFEPFVNAYNRFVNTRNKSQSNAKRFFLVSSHGQTATLWLASALNAHNDVFCVHGYDYPPTGATGKDLTTEEHLARRAAITERYWKLTINQYLNELQSATDKNIIGNVHGFTYGRLIQLNKKLKKSFRNNLKIMNMMRHPVARIDSTVHCWVDPNKPNDINPFVQDAFDNRCAEMRQFLQEKHHVEFTGREINFVVAIETMLHITKDIENAIEHNVHNISFEKITTDEKYFKEVACSLFDKDISNDEISRMFSTQLINKHNRGKATTIAEQYAKWADWQKDAYKFFFETNGLHQTYQQFEYDFSFI